MGSCCTGDPAGQTRRQPSPRRRTRSGQRLDVYSEHGLPVASDSEGFAAFPFLLKLYADGGYQGAEFQAAAQRTMAQVNVEIVKRSDGVRGFVILPKRWLVERSFAWLNRCRRLAKDWECLSRKALAFLRLASIRLMLRKLCIQT